MRAIANAPLGDARQLLDDAEVRLGLGEDPRPLDLDRDQRPVVEPRLVDLRRRRRRERASGSKVAYSTSGGEPSSFVTIATTSS